MSESRSHFEQVQPTYMEAWPDELMRLSIPSVRLRLTRGEAISLGKWNHVWGEVFWEHFGAATEEDKQNIEEIRAGLDFAVSRTPAGAFVRLGSRSPKDSWQAHGARYRADNGEQAFDFLTDESERIHDDLMLALFNDYLPSIYVREWVHIFAEYEFRCFMRDRQLVGISKYNYREAEVVSRDGLATLKLALPEMEGLIRDWFPAFRDASHLDTVVFDVFLDTGGKVRLLEINPFFAYTDPCLFDWKRPEMFDGRFLYREPVSMDAQVDLGKYGEHAEAVLDELRRHEPGVDIGFDAGIEVGGTSVKDPNAVALGRLGGLKGGVARAERMSPEERSDAARRAAEARWSK